MLVVQAGLVCGCGVGWGSAQVAFLNCWRGAEGVRILLSHATLGGEGGLLLLKHGACAHTPTYFGVCYQHALGHISAVVVRSEHGVLQGAEEPISFP